MPGNLDLDEFDFLLGTPHEQSQNEIKHNPMTTPGNGQLSKKRLRVAELISHNDELVRRLKELEEQQQQLSSVKQTANEVTELYQQEKKQRIELERRALEEDDRCSDLEKQLDVLKLNCEQLQEQAKLNCLPVDARDMVIIFIQLALRILGDPSSNGLTRSEQNMLRKLKDYCKSANISLPPLKSPSKKRAKVTSAPQSTSSTQTLDTQTSDQPIRPEMCSIAVQSENFVTTRDQGIQHKNTTTTRGTTTALLIQTRDVGTSFPEPNPPLNADQILNKMLAWANAPLSPINDETSAAEASPMISVATCTELCDIYREIDFLPHLPAELKHSNSRPPSRGMCDSVKDELAMPDDAAALDGYSNSMAKELLSFLPHNQSVLAKMPPQVFEEVWQVMGRMVRVALQSHSASSISQADFRNWFDTLYESHHTHNEAPSGDISNKETKFVAPADEGMSPDARTGPIKPPTPEIVLDLSPIRLPSKPQFEAKRNPKPKKKKRTEEMKIAKSTSSSETAVNFLTKLDAFHYPNCDNLDIQLNAEERQLLQLASGTATNKLPSIASVDCEKSTPQSSLKDFSHSLDTPLDESLNVDESQHIHSEPSVSHSVPTVPALVNKKNTGSFKSLFGNDSDSDSGDERMHKKMKVAIEETHANSNSLSSMNSSIADEDIPKDRDVQHKNVSFESNFSVPTVPALVNKKITGGFKSLFGYDSDSDSGDEQMHKKMKVAIEETHANSNSLSSMNSSIADEDIPKDCDVQHKDVSFESNFSVPTAPALVNKKNTGAFQSLFGNDSDSDSGDEQMHKKMNLGIEETNANSNNLSSMNSSIADEDIPKDCDVQHKDVSFKSNLVNNKGDLRSDPDPIQNTKLPDVSEPSVKLCTYEREQKPSLCSLSASQSGGIDEENTVTSDDNTNQHNDVSTQPVPIPRVIHKRKRKLKKKKGKSTINKESIHPSASQTGCIDEENIVTSDDNTVTSDDNTVTSDDNTNLHNDVSSQPVPIPPVIHKQKRKVKKKKGKSTLDKESIDCIDESVDNNSVSGDLPNVADDHDSNAENLAVILPAEIQEIEPSICETIVSQLASHDESEDSDMGSMNANLIINEADDLHTDCEPNKEVLPMSICIDKEEARKDSSHSNLVINEDLHSDSDHNEDACLSNTIESQPVIIPLGKRKRKANSLSESNTPAAHGADKNLVSECHDADKQSIGKEPAIKRKRNLRISTSSESPVEKPLTRSRTKQLLMDVDNHEPSKGKVVQPSYIYENSPMSPVNPASYESTDSVPIDIPLESNDLELSNAPKALLCYMINAVKTDPSKHCRQRQKRMKKERKDLNSQVIEYFELSSSSSLEQASAEFLAGEEQLLFNTLITVYGTVSIKAGAKDVLVLERLLTLLQHLEYKRSSFIERFMASLEQYLFNPKVRLSDQEVYKYIKLFLQLIGLQASLANPVENYVNPARLLIAKILYHYKYMSVFVLEVLSHFPTVLPHREQRDYDHSDPLITVIKHLLMCYQYDVSNPDGPDRALISKLRFEYHFQPFEPTKQQVIENLMDKIKAGRTHQLCYAFALFCKRSVKLNVANLLEKELIPLANSYCDLCVQSEEYDTSLECLLQCISMIIKQLPLDSQVDIISHLTVFKRMLLAVPRPRVQEAAVQAILRTQRFGYGFVVDALKNYRPDYQLTLMTRAMLRSFVERRHQYMLAVKA